MSMLTPYQPSYKEHHVDGLRGRCFGISRAWEASDVPLKADLGWAMAIVQEPMPQASLISATLKCNLPTGQVRRHVTVFETKEDHTWQLHRERKGSESSTSKKVGVR